MVKTNLIILMAKITMTNKTFYNWLWNFWNFWIKQHVTSSSKSDWLKFRIQHSTQLPISWNCINLTVIKIPYMYLFFRSNSQCLVNPCLLHYCRVCNIQLNSCRQAKIHSEGKKHEKRLSYLKFCLESSKNPRSNKQFNKMGWNHYHCF